MNTNWMEKYYPPMFEVIPEKYKEGVLNKLNRYLLPMSDEEQEFVREWNLESMLDDEYYKKLHDAFLSMIS